MAETETRTAKVPNVYLTEEAHQMLTERCKAAGQTRGTYISELILAAPADRPAPDTVTKLERVKDRSVAITAAAHAAMEAQRVDAGKTKKQWVSGLLVQVAAA